MVIQHNLSALNSSRQLNITSNSLAASTEKLSSGYQINRSADDAAGLSISEKMRKEIRGLNRASRNIEEGISYVQVADGALNEVQDMLQRINELSVQAANGTNSATDRSYINDEVQQLKTEMERIFETTSFNERKIWDASNPTVVKEVVATVDVQAVTMTTPTYQRVTIDNDNYDIVAYNGYTVHANETEGVYVSWTGYNGTDYRTRNITWAELEENGYSFQLNKYFQTDTSAAEYDPDLFDANGNAINLSYTISFSPRDGATIAEIVKGVNGVHYSASHSSSMSGTLSTKSGSVYLSGASVNYSAMYASRYYANTAGGETGNDFESGNTNFLQADTSANSSGGNFSQLPADNTSDVSTAQQSTQNWQVKYTMEGIGTVSSECTGISYYANDTDEDDEDYWWHYYTYQGKKYKSTYSWSSSEYGSGTLGSVMAALDGPKIKHDTSGTPGLIDGADSGGYITLSFSLKADNAYTYGGSASSTGIGSYSIRIKVSSSDTYQSVLDNINNALNATSILDFYASSSNSYESFNYTSETPQAAEISYMTVNNIAKDKIYNNIDLAIHSGADDTDKINLDYECLRLKTIGMTDTNTLTEESALDAIDEVAEALNIVSAQRSLFGAYQNRMEHAYKIDTNSSENTQSAESQIRDTDMAEEMVNYSNINILTQAGQSMLAQANQANQGLLSLLQ